jgi:two-component system, cell cycle response regulator DivK
VFERALVLLIEDNEQNLELAQFLLEQAGHRVHVARDAAEARLRIDEEPPGVILLDMDLPGTDGLTLVKELRARPGLERVPIVAVTAHAMRGDRDRFLSRGCDGYIPKPIQVKQFVAEVERYLKKDSIDGR